MAIDIEIAEAIVELGRKYDGNAVKVMHELPRLFPEASRRPTETTVKSYLVRYGCYKPGKGGGAGNSQRRDGGSAGSVPTRIGRKASKYGPYSYCEAV